MQRLISSIAIFFCYTIAGFCLWAIGAALVTAPVDALLLFPFGLRMGILLQTPRRYWPGILAGDVAVQLFLSHQLGGGSWLWGTLGGLLLCMTLAWASGDWLRRQQRQEVEWRWPLQQGALVALAALIQALSWSLATGAMPGPALIPLLVGFISLHFSWRYGMIIPGIIGIVLGLLMCWRLRDKPVTMGLPSVGKWRNDALELVQESEGKGLSNKEIIKRYVLTNKYIWLLAVSYVLVYIVRTAINDWGNLYLTQTKGYSLMTANSALSLFEVGGFIGSLVAGWGSDRLFRGNRGPMNLIFAIGIFLSVAALWLMPGGSYALQAACFFSIGFFIFGPQMLIGMAAAECSHKDAAGAATGFVGLFAYLGAALSGYPIARVMEVWHWNGFFVVISVAACLSALFLLPFLRAQKADSKAPPAVQANA